MSITLQNLHDRLEPFLLVHIPKENLDLLVDADFLRIFNDVANDLNLAADIRWERFYKKCTTANAEDTDLTNYLLDGDIAKIISFKYKASTWRTQYYSYTADRVVLKVAPSSDTQLYIHYIRDTEDLVDLTDEVDLPDSVVPDFENLIKIRMQIDYGDYKSMTYEGALEFYARKVMAKLPRRNLGGPRRSWLDSSTDDNLYEIKKNWIGMENFAADVSGDYIHVGGNS